MAHRVVLASDHGGFPLKEAIERHLRGKGVEVQDLGTHSTEACDYPVFARAAAEAVASGRATRGIVVDGAGIGSAMVANKVAGVRAGMAFDPATAKNAREHNDANVLTLGAGYLTEEKAKEIVDLFLSTDCTVDRHRRRVDMIDALDAETRKSVRSLPTMTSPTENLDSLVGRITRILADNPALLAGIGGNQSPCGQCTDHGHCASRCTDTIRSMLSGAPGARFSSAPGVRDVPADIASLIDHTLLKAEATYADIDRLCDEAAQYGFASVCVNPIFVKRAAARLDGKKPLVCTVIGFPLGATTKETKALEARRALRDGARELDMVIAIGALKSGDRQTVLEDIRLLAETAHEAGAILKVIIETALLTDEEKTLACQLARQARADFVKTSTGFSSGGATVGDVALMAKAVENKLGVKASGGIHSAAQVQSMVAAGATRIGASVGVKIARESAGLPVDSPAKKGAY